MIKNIDQLRITMQQMERLILALDDLKVNVLPRNPELFATMAEAPLEDLDRLREEVSGYVHELKPTA
ncbi:MAG: hypothetical protein WD063_03175 [Pirellulales bacterium]